MNRNNINDQHRFENTRFCTISKAFQINIAVGLTQCHLLSEEVSSFFPDSSVPSVKLVLLQQHATEKKTSVKMT